MELASIEIRVPKEMTLYIRTEDKQAELERNAMLLYPYICNLVISHGRAADILGIRKHDLIELYDKLGIPYLNQDITEAEQEVTMYKQLVEQTV